MTIILRISLSHRRSSKSRRFHRPIILNGLGLLLAYLTSSCTSSSLPILNLNALNSRYTDEQPALSGDGNYLAFTSSRLGGQQLFLYDLRQRRFLPLPGISGINTAIGSPSLSYTARYIAYLTSRYGRVEIEVYDRVTQHQQMLTWGYRGWFDAPSISPDGRYVAFESSRRGQWDIEIFDRGPGIALDRPTLPLNSIPSP